MERKKIEIEIPVGCKAEWQEVDGKFVLVAVQEDENDNRPVTERIKTFEDACKEVGRLVEGGNESLANLLCDYESNADNILTNGTLAYMKLCLIAAALNEGWQPTFSDDEYRYYPWFVFYNKEELDAMDEEERSRVLDRSKSHVNAYSGVACSYTHVTMSHSGTYGSSRICFKNRELAEYAAEAFLDLWADLMLF